MWSLKKFQFWFWLATNFLSIQGPRDFAFSRSKYRKRFETVTVKTSTEIPINIQLISQLITHIIYFALFYTLSFNIFIRFLAGFCSSKRIVIQYFLSEKEMRLQMYKISWKICIILNYKVSFALPELIYNRRSPREYSAQD